MASIVFACEANGKCLVAYRCIGGDTRASLSLSLSFSLSLSLSLFLSFSLSLSLSFSLSNSEGHRGRGSPFSEDERGSGGVESVFVNCEAFVNSQAAAGRHACACSSSASTACSSSVSTACSSSVSTANICSRVPDLWPICQCL